MDNKKLFYISFIKLIASFSVLILHANGMFWNFSSTEFYWKAANVIESVFYFAVPMFFMIIGVTLFDFYDRYTLKEYFYKRFTKVFIPFIAWSIISLVASIYTKKVSISEISLSYIYKAIFEYKTVGIYWFFASLFCIYLSVPLFAAVNKNRRKEVFCYCVIAGFVFNILFPFIKSLLKLEIGLPYSIIVSSRELIFPLLGWIIHNCSFKKSEKIVIYIFGLVGLLVHLIGTYVLSMEACHIVTLFKGYTNPPCILYSIAVFVFLKNIGETLSLTRISKTIEYLSTYSFEVYLMQPYFLYITSRNPFISTHTVIYSLCAPIVIFALTVLTVYIIRKIPVLKYIVP
ncbi:MAG: acyltransferase [Lachnospiraceae bacterium]|nr:acyltransferase [Lachnospiraceae bacterium]